MARIIRAEAEENEGEFENLEVCEGDGVPMQSAERHNETMSHLTNHRPVIRRGDLISLGLGGTMKPALLLAAAVMFCSASIAFSGQDDTKSASNLYLACASAANNSPLDAEKPCNDFLSAADPKRDNRQIQCARDWIAELRANRQYIRFLWGLEPDPKAKWFVYSPDTKIEIPETNDTDGQFKIEISRHFANSTERSYLRTAEAVYPAPAQMYQRGLTTSHLCKQDRTSEMVPVFGGCGNDNIEMTEIVTARSVLYYVDMTQLARMNPKLPSGFTAVETDLKYVANIQYFTKYTHGGRTLRNVYVADLTMKWSFACGFLCGVGFTRNKVVVLDSRGNVIGLYLDAAVNRES